MWLNNTNICAVYCTNSWRKFVFFLPLFTFFISSISCRRKQNPFISPSLCIFYHHWYSLEDSRLIYTQIFSISFLKFRVCLIFCSSERPLLPPSFVHLSKEVIWHSTPIFFVNMLKSLIILTSGWNSCFIIFNIFYLN